MHTRPKARFCLEFDPGVHRLTRVRFEYDGKAVSDLRVAAGRARRDNDELSWEKGLRAWTALLLEYALRREAGHFVDQSHPFTVDVLSRPEYAAAWNALNKPTWIDSICSSGRLGRYASRIFVPRNVQGERLIEIDRAELAPDGIDVQSKHALSDLYSGIVRVLTRDDPPVQDSRALSTLEQWEAIRADHVTNLRMRKNEFDALQRKGLAARVRGALTDMYMLPELAIVGAVGAGVRSFDELADFTGLDVGQLTRALGRVADKVRVSNGLLTASAHPCKLVICDWTDTLVDECELDDRICEFIPSDPDPDTGARNRHQFLELLHQLEEAKSPQWYDYAYLGSHFGKSVPQLEAEHRKNRQWIRALCDVPKLVRAIRACGALPAIATNCNSRVLRWRAEMLGIDLDEFALVVASDQVSDIRDKAAHYEKLLKHFNFHPGSILVVSDDHQKDLVPAKALGLSTAWVHAGFLDGNSASERRKRLRSEYGTPSLPADLVLHHTARHRLQGRVADYLVFSPEHILPYIQGSNRA